MKFTEIREQGRRKIPGRIIAFGFLFALIVGWLLYTVPLKKEVSFTYEGVEWIFETNEIIGRTDITMEGELFFYLFQPDRFSGTLEVEGFAPYSTDGLPIPLGPAFPIGFDLDVFPHIVTAALKGEICKLQRVSDGRKVGRFLMPPDFPDSVLLSLSGEGSRYIAAPAKDAEDAREIWERTHGISYLKPNEESTS